MRGPNSVDSPEVQADCLCHRFTFITPFYIFIPSFHRITSSQPAGISELALVDLEQPGPSSLCHRDRTRTWIDTFAASKSQSHVTLVATPTRSITVMPVSPKSSPSRLKPLSFNTSHEPTCSPPHRPVPQYAAVYRPSPLPNPE